jgi:phage tail sheath protein FI
MPEYLAPGVYVEETSFRAKTIEGVSTSTAGFVGPARFGPLAGDPELITSLADFERIYGGLEDLEFQTANGAVRQPNYLAHAVRAFFEEGGKRLYVSRVINFGVTGYNEQTHTQGSTSVYASTDSSGSSPPAPDIRFIARFPGAAGNLRITLTLRVGANMLTTLPNGAASLTGAREYLLVTVRPRTAFPRQADLYIVRRDLANNRWLLGGNGLAAPLPLSDPQFTNTEVLPVTVSIDLEHPTFDSQGFPAFRAPEPFGEFDVDPRSSRALSQTFMAVPPTRELFLTTPLAMIVPTDFGAGDELAAAIIRELFWPVLPTLSEDNVALARRQVSFMLAGGRDGDLPTSANYAGDPATFADLITPPDSVNTPKNGLLAFEAVEDISIIAAPGSSALYQDQQQQDRAFSIQNEVINHCEQMRYRVAILDVPPDQLITGALAFRNRRESKYAAMYYPWIIVADPFTGNRLKLPPSGNMAGIYARNDIEHAVFKTPANEVVRMAIDFEQRLNKAQQEALNPNGVNCLRFFDGRGFLVWGGRTISTDSEWKYLSVRRYFAYLERSIDRGTQWVVFENNGPQLWDNVRRTIEDFLLNEWKSGGLLGAKPEQAYFVRCDRSTMTQNDLDNGRLVCLIGIAPVKPAEFVIFRIGQWTASANQ